MNHIILLCLTGFFCAAAQAADPPKYCEDAGSEIVTCVAPDGSAIYSKESGEVVYCSHDANGIPHCVKEE